MRSTPWLFSNNDVSNVCNQTAGLYAQFASADIGTGYNTDGTFLNVGGAKDHSFDFIDVIYEHYRRTGLTDVWVRFQAIASNTFAYNGLSNHLVYIRGGLGQSYTGCGWGFSESLSIAGYHTGCSLFRYRACQELDILTRATGHATTFYTNEMVQIKNNLETYLFDAGQNLFYAGTLNKTYNVDDNPELTITNHDVYMSAYAVVLGAGSTTVLDAVAWRLQGLTTTATTRAGMLAGFPAWEDTYTIRGGLMAQIPVGTYQGGGYWPEFTSWVARAIRRVNQRSADRLMEDLAGRYAAQSAATVPYEAEDTLDSGGGTGRLCIWIRRACRSCIGQQMLSNDENESRSPPNATLGGLLWWFRSNKL
jgi:hypothetical protein